MTDIKNIMILNWQKSTQRICQKKKGVSLISIFNASGMSDARLPDIHFIEGKKIEQSMTWAEFKSTAREFYK